MARQRKTKRQKQKAAFHRQNKKEFSSSSSTVITNNEKELKNENSGANLATILDIKSIKRDLLRTAIFSVLAIGAELLLYLRR